MHGEPGFGAEHVTGAELFQISAPGMPIGVEQVANKVLQAELGC